MSPAHRLISLALSFFLVFHFQSTAAVAAAADDVVVQTCNIAAARDRNVRSDVCVKSLAAAAASESVNLFELGAISIEMARRKANETMSAIESLLKKKKNKSSEALKDCERLYTDAAAALRAATADYLSRRYGDAKLKLTAVMAAVSACEDGFENQRRAVSPLTKRNADAFQLSAVSFSIVSMRPRP